MLIRKNCSIMPVASGERALSAKIAIVLIDPAEPVIGSKSNVSNRKASSLSATSRQARRRSRRSCWLRIEAINWSMSEAWELVLRLARRQTSGR